MRLTATVLLVLGLVLAGLASSFAAPARNGWTISAEKTSATSHWVVVQGRAPVKSGKMRIERLHDGKWRVVKRTHVSRHRYRVKVWAPTGWSWFRAAKWNRSAKAAVRVPRQVVRNPRATTKQTKTAMPLATSTVLPQPSVTPAPAPAPTPTVPTVLPEPTPGVSAPASSAEVVAGAEGEPEAEAPELVDDCGVRPVKDDGTRWTCTFSEDFDGTALDRNVWTPQRSRAAGGDGVFACYTDRPENIAVADGTLRLTARDDSPPEACGATQPGKYYTGATVTTYRTFSQRYGRFEARMRNTPTTVPGLHEAFWMWPDDRSSTIDWPASGEIDVAETYSEYPTLSVPFLHYTEDDNGGPRPGLNTAWDCTAHRGEWNTFRLDWDPDSLTIRVNDRVCLENTSADPAFQKPYILLLSQAVGVGTNAVTAETPFPATVEVDYVRAWR
jgi:beta-glucanase (GH16 family)